MHCCVPFKLICFFLINIEAVLKKKLFSIIMECDVDNFFHMKFRHLNLSGLIFLCSHILAYIVLM